MIITYWQTVARCYDRYGMRTAGSLPWRSGPAKTEGRYVAAQVPYPHARFATGQPANARKSTGPRTEEGKRRTRLNSLKHGLRSRSFRESLIKSGESTTLVDRNFLFYNLLLLPQKRHEVRRIADFVRLLWSVGHWERRRQVKAGTLDPMVKEWETRLYLNRLLSAAQEQVGNLARVAGVHEESRVGNQPYLKKKATHPRASWSSFADWSGAAAWNWCFPSFA